MAETTALRVRSLAIPAGPIEVRVEALDVGRGEVLAILGPNGSGKTTLVRALAGLPAPVAGTVTAAGAVGYLPQRPVLFSGSVLRNAALPLRLRRVPREQAAERATAALETFGVADLAGRPAVQLSGGEARRVALARVVACDPDVLLLDEPFGGLDAPTRERLVSDVAAWTGAGRSSGTALVIVTHDREEAVVLARRVAVLVDGRIVQDAGVEEVFTRPADERVAELVGAENILFGRVLAAGDGVLTVAAGALRLHAIGAAAVGDEVVVAIRPEAIVLAPAADASPSSARNRIVCTVHALERRPSLVRVILDAGGVRLVCAVAPGTVDEMALRPGAAVTALAKATSAHATRRG